jgi:hypothetical protein
LPILSCMYSPHYAFQNSLISALPIVYFGSTALSFIKRQQNSVWFQSTPKYIILFCLDDYMTIIRPSSQNLEYVYTCVHIRTLAYVWNFVPWCAEEYRCVENWETLTWDKQLHITWSILSPVSCRSHLYCTTRRNYGDSRPQLGSSQQDLQLLPTQTDVTSNLNVMTSRDSRRLRRSFVLVQ